MSGADPDRGASALDPSGQLGDPDRSAVSAESGRHAGEPASAAASPSAASQPLTSLSALLGSSFEGGQACDADGSCG